jgi:folylpolyglutamate synthase/dihydropteroate synthase
MDNIKEGFAYLDGLIAEFKFKKIPTLNAINSYLDYFNRPELTYKYRIIIAGTAGKGTTSRAIEKILLDSNISTLTLYSPHIQTVLERVRICGSLIDKEFFSKILLEIKEVNNKINVKISFYECLTLLGILAGKYKQCDTLICEVGLGGDFDATNAISGSRYSVLTFVDLDHTEILGETKEKIADKKLGIVTKDTIKFLTYEKDIKEYFIKNAVIKPIFYNFENFSNERLAVKVCEELLDKKINSIPHIILPCRFEKISDNVYLDGAHSKVRILDLKKKISDIKGKKIAVIGMVKGHDHKDLKLIIELFDEIYWTKMNFIRPYYEPKFLQEYFKCGKVILNYIEFIKKSNKDINIFVFGSFYLAGDIRKEYIYTKNIEKNHSEFL